MSARKPAAGKASKAFGAEVKRRRLALGWTQEQLAERARVGLDTIRRMEHARGAAGLAMAMKIAEAFGVSVAEMFETRALSPAALEVAIRFDAITKPAQREAILELLQGLARTEHKPAKGSRRS